MSTEMSSSKASSSSSNKKKSPPVNAKNGGTNKRAKKANAGDYFHWTDERDEAFTSLIITNQVNSQKTTLKQKQSWDLTVKQCFDQDCFDNDKLKWFDGLADKPDLREALIRRFKSRLATLKTTCDTFMKSKFSSEHISNK